MGTNLQCPSWCDQGDRPHTEHEATIGTWFGVAQTGPRRSIEAQLVIHGYTTDDAAPMLALVDGLAQTDVTLTWDEWHEMAMAMVGEHRRFRRLGTPQD